MKKEGGELTCGAGVAVTERGGGGGSVRAGSWAGWAARKGNGENCWASAFGPGRGEGSVFLFFFIIIIFQSLFQIEF